MVRRARTDALTHLQRFKTGDLAECLCAFDVAQENPAAIEEDR